MECIDCPAKGINCARRDAIEVLAGFYAPKQSSNPNATLTIVAWQCPDPFGCLGGTQLGNDSCATGHEGLLCGVCGASYYPNRNTCEACDEGGDRSKVTRVFMLTGMVGALLLVGCALYLYQGLRLEIPKDSKAPTAAKDASALEQGGEASEQGGLDAARVAVRRRFRRFWKLLSLLPKRLVSASTFVRILFGYVQCVTILLRFRNVQWPSRFVSFLEVLEYATIDIFALLPIACVNDEQLGFATELTITAALPLLSVLLLMVLTVLIVPCAGHISSCQSAEHLWAALLSRAELWDLVLFFFLFEYPVVARKTLATFDCLSLGDGVHLLADDTTVTCYDSQWWTSAVVAAAGVGLFCLGLPLATLLISRTSHRGSAAHRRLVHVLTWIYDDSCWYMESVDLMRKLLLTGVACVAWRDTRKQLFFGSLVCLLFLAVHLRLKPYRDPSCDTLHGIVMTQLLVTYMIGQLFYFDPEDALAAAANAESDTIGDLVLLGTNSLAFLYLLFVDAGGIRHLAHEMSDVRLMWQGAPALVRPAQQQCLQCPTTTALSAAPSHTTAALFAFPPLPAYSPTLTLAHLAHQMARSSSCTTRPPGASTSSSRTTRSPRRSSS